MNTQVQKGERKIKRSSTFFVSFFKGFIYTVIIFPGAIKKKKKDFVLLLLLSQKQWKREKKSVWCVVLFHFVSKVSYRVLNVLCLGWRKRHDVKYNQQ